MNGVPAGSFQTGPDWHTATIEFGTGWREMRVELRVPEGHAPGDSRALGILLRSFRVRQTGAAALPALSQVAAGVLLAAFVLSPGGAARIEANCVLGGGRAGRPGFVVRTAGSPVGVGCLVLWSRLLRARGRRLIAGGGLLMRARPLSELGWPGARRACWLRWPSPSCSGWVGLPIPRHT